MTGPEGTPPTPREDGKVRSTIRTAQGHYGRVRTWFEEFIETRRATTPLIDVLVRLYERDKQDDGGVVASAVALRVFLFLIPLVLTLVAGLGFVANHLSTTDASHEAGVSGGVATQINNALHQSKNTRWFALGTGLVGMVFAGRSLARVLAAANRRAWRLPVGTSKATTRLAGAIAGLLGAAGALAIIANRVRRATGVVGGSMTVAGAGVAYGVGWLLVCLTLPRGRADRSALLPGAVFVGVACSVLQWLLQFEAPGKLSRASQLYGSIGVVIVALSWFFLIGRVFVASFTLDAVLWERFGSLTTWMMQWSRLRRSVEKHPRVQRFLEAGDEELEPIESEDGEPPG